MKFSKKELGERLQAELRKGYNVERISNWAYDLVFKIHESELRSIVDQISLIATGPEFEYSEEELRLLLKC